MSDVPTAEELPDVKSERTVNLADMNRATRRQFRRALNAEHRKNTRYYRRHSTMPQWQAENLAKEAQRRQAKQQAEWGAINRAYELEIASA
jgi:hypothetical protein